MRQCPWPGAQARSEDGSEALDGGSADSPVVAPPGPCTLRLTTGECAQILNRMVDQETALDGIFAALASPVRRHTLDTLGAGARSASELAAPYGMSLTGFMKHLRVLHDAGLVSCRKEGRTVTCSLTRQPLDPAARWLQSRERLWNARLDALGRHLYHREQIAARSAAAMTKGKPR